LTARESFAKVLKDLRLSHNLSQERLGEKANLSMRTISLLECNKTQPTISTLEAIAKAFDLQISDLIIATEKQLTK
jgi:transcriptional regulator with XRE-family HTH domain